MKMERETENITCRYKAIFLPLCEHIRSERKRVMKLGKNFLPPPFFSLYLEMSHTSEKIVKLHTMFHGK